ncbi:DNA polymerase III subunit delta [Bacillus sp. CGMCC 1.16541]|uniref:DNA polymerase III subunit delta n=1 Tax=Bacillus sp. CGMCC 1.16541 TaxID=2185143 RepID=UPI000D7352B1|nr:DNA polymerase III subunit delta [Bacillus sp. CGMCC 1.16541]
MELKSLQELKKAKIAPVYLIYGVNSFLIKEARKEIINQTLSEEEKSFNLSTYDLEETPIEQVIEDAETLPFFGDKRVVIAHNASFLTADKQKSKVKVEHHVEKLLQYIEHPSSFTVLIIIAPYEKLDERKKMTKVLKNQTLCVMANEFGEKEMREWICDYASSNSVTIDEEAVTLLLQLVGLNLTLITNELDKLMLYSGEGGHLTQDVVLLLVAKTLEQNVFTLVEAVIKGKVSEALSMYQDLLRNNEEPIKILSILASQFRLIYHAKQLSSQGYGQQQIAQTLKVHPFRVKLAVQQSRAFSEERLRSILKDIAQADYDMKTGKMDKSLILELFFLKQAH